jgi:hypothetical protein
MADTRLHFYIWSVTHGYTLTVTYTLLHINILNLKKRVVTWLHFFRGFVSAHQTFNRE